MHNVPTLSSSRCRALLALSLSVAVSLAMGERAAAAEPAVAGFGATGGAPQAPWHVQGLPQQGSKPLTRFSDLRSRSGDDTAIKVCVFFDMPIDNMSFTDRQLLRLARSKTTDFQPTATVCYVWDTQLPIGTTLDNAFTRRVRYMVLQSGKDRLDRWIGEKRDIAADFVKLFGDESKTVPPVLGVSVGADSDNTKGHVVSYVSGLVLEP